MNKRKEIHSAYTDKEAAIEAIIRNFDHEGDTFGNQDRNSLKEFRLKDEKIIVKSFRTPNVVNQIAYKFFRKSKAERSYIYANRLVDLEIGTPTPMAYFEFVTPLLFKKSYYLSAYQDCDLTFRELTTNLNYPQHEAILRAFTRFTFELHEKSIHFLDHSPGNTLIKIDKDSFNFYLVDLNRMNFGTLDFETRIKNFARLTIHKAMVEIMSDEYAKCIGKPYEKVFNLMWYETQMFQAKYHRKRRLKKRFKFWKT